ncbi:virulence factor [Helicobacter cetorum]|uniref:virulence factor n=1 Tax=Helicobacter cetorum TaxID=138563 RepID=UPI000CF0FDE3|nr:virulence factor [Helicobacter cetorum]
MYAIVFDLDTKALEKHYPNSNWRKAYEDIALFLQDYGFTKQQGSTYFGDSLVNAISCVTAVQDLSLEFEWLEFCVKDMRMLRIEDNNDLMPAIKKNLRKPKRRFMA